MTHRVLLLSKRQQPDNVTESESEWQGDSCW